MIERKDAPTTEDATKFVQFMEACARDVPAAVIVPT